MTLKYSRTAVPSLEQDRVCAPKLSNIRSSQRLQRLRTSFTRLLLGHLVLNFPRVLAQNSPKLREILARHSAHPSTLR